MIQFDILRGIHSDLHHVSEEVSYIFHNTSSLMLLNFFQVNTLLGFQMLANLITNVVILIMFGFFTIAGALDGKLYWPFLIIMLTPAIRLMLVGHWGQILKDTVSFKSEQRSFQLQKRLYNHKFLLLCLENLSTA